MSSRLDRSAQARASTAPVAAPTRDGGAGTGASDLWATYAATRTLLWLDRLPSAERRAEIARWIESRRNDDGSYSWQRGLEPDVWATFYCVQARQDLDLRVERAPALAGWLGTLQDAEGGFAMRAGQAADAWATYYATRLHRESVGAAPPRRDALAAWLASLQRASGGLAWAPDHPDVDVRAAYYAVHARAAAGLPRPLWDEGALAAWLAGMQGADGGFRFADGYAPCLWATFRATRALAALGAPVRDRAAAIGWIMARKDEMGFQRWSDYPVSDVWANFCAVGALSALGADADAATADTVEAAITRYAVSGGGYTYREPWRAADALTTAACLFGDALAGLGAAPRARGLARWLRDAHMPYEGGVMYMPGRGAEVRCTLWTIAALAAVGDALPDRDRLLAWIRDLQNGDGGFGYWQGRGSDLVSTTAAWGIVEALGETPGRVLDVDGVRAFVARCRVGQGASNLPAGNATATATAQASRLLAALGEGDAADALADSLSAYERLGGFADAGRRIPDLYATYQCCLAHQRLGRHDTLRAAPGFLRKLVGADGAVRWSPFGQGPQDPLAAALHGLLARAADPSGRRLPELVL